MPPWTADRRSAANRRSPDRYADLADGRRIAVDVRGDPVGIPVLYLHGTPDTRVARHPDDSIARDLGARVIAADRPGLGSSDPDPGATPRTVARDHVAVLDDLDLPSAHVVSWSAGSIHALAFAGSHPERIGSLTLIAPLVPVDAYTDPSVLDGSAPSRHLFAEHLGTTRPDELGRELASWLVPPEIDDAIAREMLDDSLARVAHVPGAGDALVSGLQGSVAQGTIGLEREIAAQATPLGDLLDQVTTPVAVHVGVHDTVTPVAMARWVADRLDAALHEHEAGHELGITAWAELLHAITAP